LGLNIDKFIPGFGDSAESWFHNTPNHPAREVIENIVAQQGLPIAAHPGERPTYLEKLLLNRGPWEYEDLIDDRLCHMQIFNGRRTDSFDAGYLLWKRLLLEGRRKLIVAGSDAHGNFNRLRQIGTPFLTLRESNQQIFGYSRTLVYLGDEIPSRKNLLEAISRGNCIITDGPFLELILEDNSGNRKIPGDTIKDFENGSWKMKLTLKSSKEGGALEKLVVLYGAKGGGDETTIIEKKEFGEGFEHRFEYAEVPIPPNSNDFSYVRAELTTAGDKICMTNPIWMIRQLS
jgi:hypothetical protein